MRLIKITVKHENSEIINFAEKNSVQFGIFTNILSKIEFVDFTNESGYASFLCVVSESQISTMINCFIDLSIDFSVDDITNSVLFSDEINTNYFDSGLSVANDLNQLIDRFYNDNIDVDIILDKINLRGLDSLSPKDKFVLENF